MRFIIFELLLLSTAFTQQTPDYRLGSWRGRTVAYRMVNGLAIAEGDIVLDRVEELERLPAKDAHRDATGVNVDLLRWTNRTVPYIIDSAIPTPKRVTDAIQHWNDNSVIQMVAHTDEKNYVRFVRDNSNGGACSSSIGMVGGEQRIQTDDGCTAGALIHEIGHAVGLNHEQSRIDRDRYVTINWDDIDPRRFHDFNQAISGSADYGLYDYGSIMHYTATSGFENKLLVSSLQTIPRGIPVGQLAGLSSGDLDAVSRMYGATVTATVVTTFPSGLDLIVDGARITSPKSFDWAPGSTHTVDVPPSQGNATVRYLFARWNDDGDQSHTITASKDVTVFEAAFIRQFFIPKGASPAAGGTVIIDPSSDDGFYTDGAPVVVTAQPAAGFAFASWSLVPTGVHGLADNPAITRMTSNFNYTAAFTATPLNVLLDSTPPHRTVSGDGSSHGALWGALWNIGTSHTIATPTTQSGPSGVARYVFTGWSDNADASHAITATATPTTYTANFRTDYLLTVLLDGNGTVDRTPASTDGYYESGTAVQLTPRPAPGFQFVNWTGDLTGTDPNAAVTMNGQRVITALFRAAGSTPFNGTLNAATLQQTNYVSPGELLVIDGTQGAPADTLLTAQPAADGTISTTLGDTRVMIDGKFAPVLNVKGNEVTTMVPFTSAGKAAVPVQIVYLNKANTFVNIEMVTAVPGIFTVDGSGSGPARVTNQDGSANGDGNPAARGSVIAFHGTGFGKMSPAIGDAAVVGDTPPVPELPVSVSIGGVDAPVTSATGVKGNLGGLVQVSVTVPDGVPSGAVPLLLKVGTQVARQHVTVAIQ